MLYQSIFYRFSVVQYSKAHVEIVSKDPCKYYIPLPKKKIKIILQGPCENTFCQCEMGHGWLQTCQVVDKSDKEHQENYFKWLISLFLEQEGTYFDELMCVCNWPWNIPGCEDDLDGQADLELGLQEQAQGLQTPHRPQPRCTKLAILP